MLLKLLWPLVKKHRGLILSILFICIFNSAVFIGLGSGYTSLENAIETFTDKYGKPDITFSTKTIDSSVIESIKKVKGVSNAFGRLVYNTVVKTEDDKYLSIKGFSFRSSDFLKFYTFSGLQPKDSKLMVSYDFANYYNLKVGDTLSVLVNEKWESLEIDSIVTCTEGISIQPFNKIIRSNDAYGYVYLNQSIIDRTELKNSFNEVVIQLSNTADSVKVQNSIEKIIGSENITDVITYQNSIIFTKFKRNLASVSILTNFIPTIFFIIVLVIVFLLLNLLVKQNRKEIALLRSLGYRKWKIRALFCIETSAVTLIASAIGSVLSLGFTWFILYGYARFLTIFEYTVSTSLSVVLKCVCLTLIFNNTATLIATLEIDRIQPADAFKSQIQTSAKIPDIVKSGRFSAVTKVNIFSLLRSKTRFFFTVICFSGTMVMMLASSLFKLSTTNTVNKTWKERIQFDAQILFRDTPDEDLLNSLPTTVLDKTAIYYTEISTDYTSEMTTVEAISSPLKSQNLKDEDGNQLVMPSADEIIISTTIANTLDVKVGDKVKVNGKTFTVSQISNQCSLSTQFISSDNLSELGQPSCYSVYCNDSDINGLTQIVVFSKDYLFSYISKDNYNKMLRVINLYNIAITLIMVFAIAVGLIIDCNIIRSIIIDRKKDFCVLRSVGFSIKDISKSFFKVTLTQFLMALPIGIFCGILMGNLFTNKLSDSIDIIEFVIKPLQIIIMVALSFLYFVIGHFISMNYIKKLNLPSEIKVCD